MKSKPPSKRTKLDPSLTPGPSESKSKQKSKQDRDDSQKPSPSTSTSSTDSVFSKSKNSSGSSLSLSKLSFPTLTSPDIPKDFPRIFQIQTSSVVKSESGENKDGPKPIEDIDALQHELESLWSIIAVRSRVIQSEAQILSTLIGNGGGIGNLGSSSFTTHYDEHHQKKINAVKNIIDSGHGTRTSVSAAAKLIMSTNDTIPPSPPPTTTNNITISNAPSSNASINTPSPISLTPILSGSSRKSNNSAAAATSSLPLPCRQPKKKLKSQLGGKLKSGAYKPARSGQNRSHSVSMDDSFLRLEAPNQFWEYADSYCREILKTDLDEIGKEIEEFRELPDTVFAIPPLGKHFKEDKTKHPPSLSSLTNGNNGTANNKGGDDKIGVREKDVVGPLTQRLVTALVEERVASIGTLNGEKEEEGERGTILPNHGLVKALGLDIAGQCTFSPLELRLKKVLTEQGYLVGDEALEPLMSTDDDEILAEIKRTFITLRKLHKHNIGRLEDLSKRAKDEFGRYSHKRALEKADKEIIEAYRAVTSCRVSRIPLSAKEKTMATKALESRQLAIDKLTKITPPSTTNSS